MADFVTRQRFDRPSHPNQFGLGTPDLWEVPLYVSIGDQQRRASSFRTDDTALANSKRFSLFTCPQPQIAWWVAANPLDGQQKFYLRYPQVTSPNPTTGEFSAVLPVGTGSGLGARYGLTSHKGSVAVNLSNNSLAQTAHQDAILGKFTSQYLQNVAIPEQTWTLAVAVSTSSVNCLPFLAASLYVWRPSTSSVVGYIYDSDDPLGPQWTTTITGHIYSIPGVAVTAQAGDVLVLEVWAHVTQTDAVAHGLNLQFSGPGSDVTEGSLGSVAGAYLSGNLGEAPVTPTQFVPATVQQVASFRVTESKGVLAARAASLLLANPNDGWESAALVTPDVYSPEDYPAIAQATASFRTGSGLPRALYGLLDQPTWVTTTVVTDKTVAITGVAGTGAAGTLAPDFSLASSGVAGTGSVGSVTAINFPTLWAAVEQEVRSFRTSDRIADKFFIRQTQPLWVSTTVATDKTVALTGVTATASVGSVVPSATVAITGVGATGGVGSLTPSITIGVTGVQGTGLLGTEADQFTLGLSGVEATGSVGSVTASGTSSPLYLPPTVQQQIASYRTPDRQSDRTFIRQTYPLWQPTSAQWAALTGNTATGTPGAVTLTNAPALTGVAATGAPGSVTPSLTVAISGIAATGGVGSVAVINYPTLWPAVEQGLRSFRTADSRADRFLSFQTWRTSFANPDVALAITGTEASGSVGSLSPTTAITGVAGSGATGTVSPSITVGLSGVSATGSLGTQAPSITVGITGVAAVPDVGTVVPDSRIAITGVVATGQVGSLSPVTALSGTEGIGSVGTATPTITVALTGTEAAGQVGDVAAGNDVSRALTGVAATGAAGSVSPAATVPVSGVSATGSVGTVAEGLSESLSGVEASAGLGSLATALTASLTGVAASGQPGSLGKATTVSLTGVEATGAVGTVTPVSGATAALTGVAGTGSAGSVTPAVTKALTGVSATASVSSLVPATATIGVQATGETGSLGSARVLAISGVSATGHAGNVVAGSAATVALTGVEAVGSVGDVTQSASVRLTSASASGQVGSVSAGGAITVAITGVSATGHVGRVVPVNPDLFVEGIEDNFNQAARGNDFDSDDRSRDFNMGARENDFPTGDRSRNFNQIDRPFKL